MARKKVTIKEKRAEAEAATKVKKKKATAKTSAAKTSAAKTSAAKTSAAKTSAAKTSAAKAKTKTKRTRKKAPTEIRLKAFWGVFNQSLKRMALYEYSQRRQADKKASELTEKGNSPHFVQLVKEVIEAE